MSFKHLLSYIVGLKLHSTASSWSVFSKLTHQNAEKETAAPVSEFDALDVAPDSLICLKKKSGVDMSQIANMVSQIMKLESEIQDLVEALECLSRHLSSCITTFSLFVAYCMKQYFAETRHVSMGSSSTPPPPQKPPEKQREEIGNKNKK